MYLSIWTAFVRKRLSETEQHDCDNETGRENGQFFYCPPTIHGSLNSEVIFSFFCKRTDGGVLRVLESIHLYF